MNGERLQRLAEYLNNLEPGKWDFRYVTNAKALDELVKMCSIEGHCETTACALGHLPCIWPDVFRWYLGEGGPKFFPVFKEHENVEDMSSIDVNDFFDITEEEFDYLFQPKGCTNSEELALPNDATQYDVASRIMEVVKFGFPDELYNEEEEEEEYDYD